MQKLTLNQKSISPQRGRYFVRNRLANALFYAFDAVLAALTALVGGENHRPKCVTKILVANGAHLGDVVVATAVLPVLKKAFPDASIGFLVGSWSAPIIRRHPLLQWVHEVDHWRVSRANLPLLKKILIWWRTRRKALREIRAVKYDLAVDLVFNFPNSIHLLWRAGIPERVGWTSAGFGPLLTIQKSMKLVDRPMIDYHLDLLRAIPGISNFDAREAIPSLPRSRRDNGPIAGDGKDIILHTSSGSSLKDWNRDKWVKLADALSEGGFRVAFTGSGTREKQQVKEIVQRLKYEAIDVCGLLRWDDFVEAVASAALVIGVDSVVGHVAAVVGVPVIVIGHGMNGLRIWTPVTSAAVVIRNPMPCAPCYQKRGCPTMDCIQGISAEIVLEKALQLLSLGPGAQEV